MGVEMGVQTRTHCRFIIGSRRSPGLLQLSAVWHHRQQSAVSTAECDDHWNRVSGSDRGPEPTRAPLTRTDQVTWSDPVTRSDQVIGTDPD